MICSRRGASRVGWRGGLRRRRRRGCRCSGGARVTPAERLAAADGKQERPAAGAAAVVERPPRGRCSNCFNGDHHDGSSSDDDFDFLPSSNPAAPLPAAGDALELLKFESQGLVQCPSTAERNLLAGASRIAGKVRPPCPRGVRGRCATPPPMPKQTMRPDSSPKKMGRCCSPWVVRRRSSAEIEEDRFQTNHGELEREQQRMAEIEREDRQPLQPLLASRRATSCLALPSAGRAATRAASPSRDRDATPPLASPGCRLHLVVPASLSPRRPEDGSQNR